MTTISTGQPSTPASTVQILLQIGQPEAEGTSLAGMDFGAALDAALIGYGEADTGDAERLLQPAQVPGVPHAGSDEDAPQTDGSTPQVLAPVQGLLPEAVMLTVNLVMRQLDAVAQGGDGESAPAGALPATGEVEGGVSQAAAMPQVTPRPAQNLATEDAGTEFLAASTGAAVPDEAESEALRQVKAIELPGVATKAAASPAAAAGSVAALKTGGAEAAAQVDADLAPVMQGNATGTSTVTQSGVAVLKLAGTESSQWREPLMQALGERLQLQSTHTLDQATIRLDPPSLGRIEIGIRHENGALTVQLSATHQEVLRQLQGIGEQLRQDLSVRHQGEVSVQVEESSASRSLFGEASADGRQRQQQGAQREAPGQALAEADDRDESARNGSGEQEQAA
ncbi:MAG: hypothetical protein CGU28_06605 [Candidatus Dactylopiibacterium carminicum]|uniref:Flagellar hook-length control protein FliK n=1 Tax=Candidatus Dactylopiibacterium carminicum TaxID=857335 RepID=A0A272EWG2_9RHOO|nr:flagellar hook-length control protein FliK [Candidatus Dactylopiibacterium carminicum]KAF7599965.1 flagellar hook-length control protein FliK [Candidatus Dactylopiibacterium carminicum]PAS94454.1 MAG: hypothetical protein CGU29_03855 [Candidatus Dactylopiibacterium carminicum]PAS97061.1 MAG: hypothetical protein CGU28_06605 [Candidatus Dactylopiibacterium carminicum]PAS99968.1 MAG: hypothetical protein BSR46_05120 [Candidatus Dactylopiibacterium carminicum]